jgi:hypothetical protein
MSVYLIPRNRVGNLLGLTFPYTPQIEYSADVKYETYNTTHTNYQLYGYTRSENPQINLQCKFSAHTEDHFKLSEYAIRFLRTYTKMNYGRRDPERGQTPRILRFYAHGTKIFNDVPVVISKFNITFPDDVDYVSGRFNADNKLIAGEFVQASGVQKKAPTTDGQFVSSIGDNTTPGSQSLGQLEPADITVNGEPQEFILRLPVFFQISISLLVQQNMYRVAHEFNLAEFASGRLNDKGYI